MNCPEDQQLISFLESGEPSSLIEHLSVCRQCQTRLETHAGERITRSIHHLKYKPASTLAERFAQIRSSTESDVNDDQLGMIGDYLIIRKIGQGGMGTVLECEDLKIRRRVAIKTIRPELVTPRVLNRLEREATNQARLNHPNIVALYEYGSSAGWPFLVMELVEGRTLRELIGSFPLPPEQAASVVAQIGRALDYAHSRGVLHRDLKPSNILIIENFTPVPGKDSPHSESVRLLSPKFVPKLFDFGLSIIIDSEHDLTQTDAILGTPAYMSPEQTQSPHANLTPASDIYSLGVILYETLTGRPPFQADNIHLTFSLIQNESPVPPSRLLPRLDKDLETICLKCLEKDPMLRYPSAQALAEDLERFLTHKPILARPAGPLLKLRRWCRRNRHEAIAIGVAALSLSALAAGSIVFAVSQSQFAKTQKQLRNIAEKNGEEAKEQSRKARLAELEARQQRDLAREQFVVSSRVIHKVGNLLDLGQFDNEAREILRKINNQFQEQVLANSEIYLKRPDLAEDSPELLPMSIYNAARAHRVLGNSEEAIRYYEWLLKLINNSSPPEDASESYRKLATIGTVELSELYLNRREYTKAITLLEPLWLNPINPGDNKPLPKDDPNYNNIRLIMGTKLFPLYERANQLEKAAAIRAELERLQPSLKK